jgi:hypothetical protein
MYMNCAPVTVSGSGGNAMFLEGLPDMFVANLLGTPCSTVEGFDFVFPQPGDSVSTGSPITIAALQGTQCPSAAPDSGGEAASGHPSEPFPSIAVAAVEIPGLTKAARMSALSPCRGDGSLVCIDETHFGLCNRGCVTRQAVADGTSCWQGSIVDNRQR